MINAKAIFIFDSDESHIGLVLTRITTVPEPVTHSLSTCRNKDHFPFLCLLFPGYLFESFKLDITTHGLLNPLILSQVCHSTIGLGSA